MRFKVILSVFAILFLGGASHPAMGQPVTIGVSPPNFYVTLGDYFQVPQSEIVVIKERQIPDDEIPVVLFMSRRANVAPAVIIEERQRGWTWSNILVTHHLSPEILYVPTVAVVEGPPYGKAYGYFKNKPHKKWKTIVLDDADVVNLVNLRVISEHYRRPPDEVIKLRSSGKNFVVIDDELKGEKTKEPKEKEKKGKGKAKETTEVKEGKKKEEVKTKELEKVKEEKGKQGAVEEKETGKGKEEAKEPGKEKEMEKGKGKK